MREQDLYPPIKALLEAQGYEVKAEIGAADVMALRGDEPPVIVELKTGLTISLLKQGVARLSLTDAVYLAVPRPKRRGRKGRGSDIALCRRLGLGLIEVALGSGTVEVLCDPGPYAPRQNMRRRDRLLREFARRRGDPNAGGQGRVGLVTAYRQEALACAAHLSEKGPCKGAHVARATGVARATRMMADNHYGWFIRVSTGIYDLSEAGRLAARDFAGSGAG